MVPELASPDIDALRIARQGVWILAVGLGGFLLWACLAPLDQGVVGSGTVIVSGERKTVQSLLGGVAQRILVREGDLVRAGQLLVQLNTVQAQAQLDVALGQWLTALSMEARLSAERLDRDAIEWPEGLLTRESDPRARQAMELQQNLFTTRKSELRNQLEMLEHERSALAEQLVSFEEIKRSFDVQIEYQREELEGMRELARSGYASRNQLLDAERGASQLAAQRASSLAELSRTRQAISENKLKSLQQVQVFRADAESQLSQVASGSSSLADQIEALEFQVDNGAIRAPVDGQVIGLAVHTEGGVILPGQKLMDVVPQHSSWVVKAHFAPVLADKLERGLPVDVRFSTLHRIRTPVLASRVATVSADQLVDEHSGQPYFSVEVEPDPQQKDLLESLSFDVKPGMQVEVLVKTGERTLMNYLLKPLSERLVGGLKEE